MNYSNTPSDYCETHMHTLLKVVFMCLFSAPFFFREEDG